MTTLKTSLSVLSLLFIVICCNKSPVEVSYVSLNTTSIEIVEGDTFTLTASVSPENAEYDDITWKSSNSSVASVSQGIVTAIQKGETTISATAGGISAICNVTVSAKLIPAKLIPVTSITIDKGDLFYIAIGETSSLSAQKSPSDATEDTFFWTSSDEGVVKVDNSGTITGIKVGTATLTFTAAVSKTSASCDVTVVNPNNIIYYTPTNAWIYSIYTPKEVTPYNSYAFGSNIIYNKCYPTDVAGGRIVFDGPVTTIGTYAFMNCGRLETIKLPDTVTEIGKQAFAGASHLKSIELSDNITSIGYEAFFECGYDGFSFKCPQKLKSIDESAFARSGLREITFNSALQSIGCRAFQESSLEEIVILGNTVLESAYLVGSYTFLGCMPLKTVEFQEGFKELPKCVFATCLQLTDVIFPSTLTKINCNSFYECPALTNLYVKAITPPEVTDIKEKSIFLKDSNKVTIWVPANSVDAYKEASGWSDVSDKIKGYDY